MHDAESDARSAPLRCSNKIVHSSSLLEDKSPDMHTSRETGNLDIARITWIKLHMCSKLGEIALAFQVLRYDISYNVPLKDVMLAWTHSSASH